MVFSLRCFVAWVWVLSTEWRETQRVCINSASSSEIALISPITWSLQLVRWFLLGRKRAHERGRILRVGGGAGGCSSNLTISCGLREKESTRSLKLTHSPRPSSAKEISALWPLPPAPLTAPYPAPPPVPGEHWASHPLPNSHTASAGPSERKAAPDPPRTTVRPQCPPDQPAAAPSSPAAGLGREQGQKETPQQSLLHLSRHCPPSCRSRRRRELGGEKGRKAGVGNPGIVADFKLASVKTDSPREQGRRSGKRRSAPGLSYLFLSKEGKGGWRHLFWRNWTVTPEWSVLASRRLRVAFHPIPRVEKATNRSRVRAALRSLGSAVMESTGTGKI